MVVVADQQPMARMQGLREQEERLLKEWELRLEIWLVV
jgi:hypothetical protein